MNIQHLKYAVTVERAGSISAAAEMLYMSQPNLSKAIRELEKTLNITIFKRTSKGAVVTGDGREFLRYARSILAQFEEMESIGRRKNNEIQSFRISVPRSSYIADAFTSFVGELDFNKPIDLDFLETNSMKAISHVSSGNSHMGIIRYKTNYESYFLSLLKDKGLEYQDVWEFEYLLLMAEDHPLAQQAHISKRDLASYIEVLHGQTLPYHEETLWEEGWDETSHNKKIYVYERGSQFDLLARVKGTYMWVSPIPADLLKRNSLLLKKCNGSGRFKDVLISAKGHSPDQFEEAFIKQLEYSIKKVSNPSG